jgi:chaperone modulatory protein CbpM
MLPHELLVFDFEHGSPAYSVYEVSEICDVSVERVVAFVEIGVLKPEGANPDEWRFPPRSIIQARRAQRLQRDLELDLTGLALALELLEDIDDLRREIHRLRAQLAQFTTGF